jgi:glycyl-tRNA synthetase beta subunit
VIDSFTTPERVVLRVSFGEKITYYYKGVKLDDTKEHLDFFLQKMNIKNPNDLRVIDNTYYCRREVECRRFFEEVKKNIGFYLEQVFIGLSIKTNPLLNLDGIVFFINNNPENIIFSNISSNDFTKINNIIYKIGSVDDYFEIFTKNKVFFEIYNRREYVNQLLADVDCSLEDKRQFVENTLLAKEKPSFSSGELTFVCDNLFLEILQKFLKKNYLFFKKDGKIFFMFVEDETKTVENHQKKIEKSVKKIEYLIKNLGIKTQNKEYRYIFNEDKITRLEKLVTFTSLWIPFCQIDNLEKVLSNFVFTTSNFLSNNLELTLLLKKYILLKDNNDMSLIELIIDCFRPFEREKTLPKEPLANAVAISNKIDNIVYFTILGELNLKVNRDEEKRNYNDLIKIILKNKIKIPLKIVIGYSIKNFLNEIIKKKQNIKFLKRYKIDKNAIVNQIVETLYGKLYFVLAKNEKNNNIMLNILINIEIMDIIENKNFKCNLLNDCKKIMDLYRYLSTGNNEVIAVYKRLNNLLLKYKNKFKFKPIINLKTKFEFKEEEELYRAYFAIRKEIRFNLFRKNYEQAMISLHKFADALNSFLDKVFIEKSAFFQKKRRVKLLFSIKYLFDKIVNFEKLITKI